MIPIVPLLMVAVTSGGCVAIRTDRIYGSDLKAADSRFGDVDDHAVIGLSPVPGLRRYLTARELARFGAHGSDLCFERQSMRLSKEAIQESILQALGEVRAHVEVLEFSLAPVPDGKLVFDLASLPKGPLYGPDTPVVWRGAVVPPAPGRSVSVWASVRVSVEQTWVENIVPLTPNDVVRPEQFLVRKGLAFPFRRDVVKDIQVLAGLRPRRTIPPGTWLSPGMFEKPFGIVKGERVSVNVVSDSVRLQFEAEAESAARVGETVILFDPLRRRTMKATVVEKGRATIDVSKLGTSRPRTALGDERDARSQ